MEMGSDSTFGTLLQRVLEELYSMEIDLDPSYFSEPFFVLEELYSMEMIP